MTSPAEPLREFPKSDAPDRRSGRLLLLIACLIFVFLAATGQLVGDVSAQACPPYCPTPIVTPAWHIHMCDEPYQEQLDDNHCMVGPGITEFPAGTDKVWIIYCHKYSDTVVVQIRDSGGGIQYVNHPDGITYEGEGCESLPFSRPNGIAPAGSPYRTSAYWPEGPFHGVSPGVEWYIGLFIAFDAENYYGNDAQADVTARDPAANTEGFITDEIQAMLYSDSDPVGFPVTLREEQPSFPVFRLTRPIGFSQIASDPSRNILKVANRDTITISYCPRSCQTPYVDTATWYALDATITPTPLPTWPGPPPTFTPTPPPQLQVEYLTVRPSPLDVGYAPEITNKGRANHLGYPDMFVGTWTQGRNPHYGMVRFDLRGVPEAATILDARLELVGRSSRFTEPGSWAVKLLEPAVDAGWRELTFEQVRTAASLGQVGPTLSDIQLGEGRINGLGFTAAMRQRIEERMAETGYLSLRVDGPGGEDNNLFAWETGVDVYGRASEPPDPDLGPALHLTYVRSSDGGNPSPPPTGPPTVTPGPGTPSATPGSPVAGTPTSTGPTAGPGSATATSGFGTPTGGTVTNTPSIGDRTATAWAATATSEVSTPSGGGTATHTPGPGTPTAPPATATNTPSIGDHTATAWAATATSAAATTPAGSATNTPGPGTPSVVPGTPTNTPSIGDRTATAWAVTATWEAGGGTPPTSDPGGGTRPASETPGPGTPSATPAGGTTDPGGPTTLPTDTATPPGERTGRQVCVLAYVDADGSGRREYPERLLPGVTIRLTHVDSGAFLTWTTDGSNEPDHCWAGLTDGTYRLRGVEYPRDYVPTGLGERSFEVPFTVDSVQYEFGAHEGPLPSATPTSAPATNTPTPTVPPTERPTPTAQPTVTGPSGEICVAVYHDRNRDGFRDPEEAYLTDVRMAIRDETGAAVRELLSDPAGPLCSRLKVGVYEAEAALAPGMVASTVQRHPVLLTLNDRAVVEFGQRLSSRVARVYLPALEAGR